MGVFFVHSSMSAVLGYDGQSVYAADNRFLDGLTSMCRSQGMGGLSIQWLAISRVGMAGANLSLCGCNCAVRWDLERAGRGIQPVVRYIEWSVIEGKQLKYPKE